MSVLLTGVHSISVLEYLRKTFSENFLRVLKSSGRLWCWHEAGRRIQLEFLCCIVRREDENKCSSHFTCWIFSHHSCVIQCGVWISLGKME